MTPILLAKDIQKIYTQGHCQVTILENCHLAIYPNHQIAIVGASGSGKSTLLHILAGLDIPNAGQVYWDTQEITQANESQRARWRAKHIGYVYQFHHLLMEFSALENVAMPLIIQGMRRSTAQQIAATVLDHVDLSKRSRAYPSELSGGERQRVALARALVSTPRCILADEPTGHLDAANAQVVFEMMMYTQQKNQCALVMVTHDDKLARRMPTVYRLNQGMLTLVD